MTDKEKLEKVRAEIERRKKEVKGQIVEFGTFESDRLGLYDDVEKYDDLLSFIDSMQEECNITGIKSKEATGKLKECMDNITDESLAKARKQLEENPQKCMYARDNYTDEDRKVLCEGCEEECKFKPTTSVWHLKNEEPLEDKQVIICISGFFYVDFYHKKDKRFYMFGNPKHYLHEIDRWVYTDDLLKVDKILIKEPVSEDLEEAAIQFATDTETGKVDVVKQSSFFWGAIYHKQQMMKDSVLCGVDGWFINNKRNCRKNGRFYKYYESTITHDKPLPMENGKDYRLIIIKEG